ncbi:MAG: flippase-like domain-containing protein, partial [Gemmatimonadaceae bacterium]|nr:flippase-like domain-containing protein [Gemmatimonadaceae bacterium]
DIAAATQVLAGTRPAIIAIAIACNVGILVLGTVLWLRLLPRRSPVASGRMFEVVSIMAGIVNTIPALVGLASGTALLASERGVGVRAAVAVLALDQLGEALAKVAVLAAAAFLLPLPEWMRAAVGAIAVIAIVMLVGLVAAARMGDGTVATRLGVGRIGRLYAWCGDLELLRHPTRAAVALLLALAMKVAEGAALLAVQHALGVELPLASAILVLGAVNLATMLPVSPGNVGTYEAAAVAAYRWLGVDHSTAMALAMASHACYLAAMVGAGAASAAVRSARVARG